MKNGELLLQLLLGLFDRANQITALFKRAAAENRDVSDAELDALAAEDDAARVRQIIANAKARNAAHP